VYARLTELLVNHDCYGRLSKEPTYNVFCACGRPVVESDFGAIVGDEIEVSRRASRDRDQVRSAR
jgi:hypothetical protein